MDARQEPDDRPPPQRHAWLRRADIAATGPAVTVTVDGTEVRLREGDSVAAAVLLAGHRVYRRTVAGGTPRAPFCMMGVCFECLVEIDGVANRQGCLVPVRNGMRIVRQLGLPPREAVTA